MSYPDLGCFAECLTCEICNPEWLDSVLNPGDPDQYDDLDIDPFEGWEPDPGGKEEGGGLFDDIDIPSVDLPGGGSATPAWDDGPGIDFEWPF